MAIRVTCTNCGAAYKLDESKIPASGGAIKCQSCGTRFAVMRPPVEAPAEAASPAPAVALVPAPAPAAAPAAEGKPLPFSNTGTHTPIQRSAPVPFGAEVTPTMPDGAGIPLPTPAKGAADPQGEVVTKP